MKKTIFLLALFAAIVWLVFGYEIVKRTQLSLQDNPTPLTTSAITTGKGIFIENCVACHGNSATGQALTGENDGQASADLTLLEGQPAGITAMKIYFGSGVMPAWRNQLSMEEIWSVIHYIESIQSPTK